VRLVSGPTSKYSYSPADGPTRALNSFQASGPNRIRPKDFQGIGRFGRANGMHFHVVAPGFSTEDVTFRFCGTRPRCSRVFATPHPNGRRIETRSTRPTRRPLLGGAFSTSGSLSMDTTGQSAQCAECRQLVGRGDECFDGVRIRHRRTRCKKDGSLIRRGAGEPFILNLLQVYLQAGHFFA
jgi:hypothetical protein